VLAYDYGLPPSISPGTPPVPQPLAEFFEPEHEVVLDLDAGKILSGTLPPAFDSATLPPCHSAQLISRSFTQPAFEHAVRRIKDHIAAGDVYQVNLAVAERFAFAGSAWGVYLRLRALNPSPWMGFADFGSWQVVSGSPELLVETRSADATIRTRPIAGTRKKTGDPARDGAMRAELTLDQKERAEHLMLLDLARNDVGRVARFGSVHVAEREVVEEYSHVFHLVSEVRGALMPGAGPAEVIAALFPGGTITGAPKRRAMEVIASLEPVARGAYTGALGWIGPDGMQLNILIRSAVITGGVAAVQAGAGIVWDSEPAREWRESLRKAAALRAALGVEEGR
jgi:4-amino-4-deoxychorismate synthase (2-amino-4-deoxychorismate-forming) component I